MGAAALIRPALIALAVALPVAGRAEPSCVGGPPDERFATCFDPGRRLAVGGEVGRDGGRATFALAYRHRLVDDDGDVEWRLEHVALDARLGERRSATTLYRGVYVRHARDGRILLPLSPPRRVYVPFDLGAEIELGAIAIDERRIDATLVRSGLYLELLRAGRFQRRLTIGPVGLWDVSAPRDLPRLALDEHRVAPFTMAGAALHLESAAGLTALDLALEGGRRWSTVDGWRTAALARASLERVVVAVDDRPLSVYGEAAIERGRGWTARLGLRLALASGRTNAR